jgi:four helix bundle protein
MKGHRDLIAWQKAMQLVIRIYNATRMFPKDELYGLASQLRRAAVSVPSNLAEGHGRNSRREFHQFVGHARGSLLEVETQLEIALNLGYLSQSDATELLSQANEVGRILNGLRTWSSHEAKASEEVADS